jgi:20S proteasome alpha/beta subunit
VTCIVAIKTKDAIYMGGDSAGSNFYNTRSRLDPKVFKNGDFVIGYTSSFRMGQILRHGIELTVPKCNPDEYMFSLCNDLVTKLSDLKFAKLSENIATGGIFIIGWKNHLYEVASDFQYIKHRDNYTAIGSGDVYALGSLFSTQDIDDPIKRITIALDAAVKFSPTVSKPYTFAHT